MNHFDTMRIQRVTESFLAALEKLKISGIHPIYVGLAGGSSLDAWYEDFLAYTEAHLEEVRELLSGVNFGFVDERVVPPDHEDSNYRAVLEKFFQPLSDLGAIAIDQAIPIDPESRDPADDYTQRFPTMHVALFGVGPDGHIASLFPRHPDNDYLLENEKFRFVSVGSNTKDANSRITMTPGMISALETAFVFFMGPKKIKAYNDFIDDEMTIDECPAKLTCRANDTFIIQQD